MSDDSGPTDFDLEDETEEITAQQVLQTLKSAWLNEKNAPDILPYQKDIVDIMLSQLAHMNDNLKQLSENDFRWKVHKMELERIRYIVASYLRCRLQKIELFTLHILNEDAVRTVNNKYLSVAELEFAREYYKSIEKHFHQIALRHMPQNHRTNDENNRIVRPNLMSHVVFKVKNSVSGLLIGTDNEEVQLEAESQHIMPYNLIADILLKGDIQLF